MIAHARFRNPLLIGPMLMLVIELVALGVFVRDGLLDKPFPVAAFVFVIAATVAAAVLGWMDP